MFNFIGNVLKQVWGEDEGKEDTVEKTKGATPTIPPANLIDQDQTLTVNTFTGHVTSIHSDYGLVDHQVYFALSLCKNFPVPKVGTKVSVSAERKHSGSGWCALSIAPVSKADDDDENWEMDTPLAETSQKSGATPLQPTQQETTCSAEDLVAMVTAVTKNIVYLNQNLRFDISSTTNDYIPIKGDWVTASIQLNATSGERHVLNVQPLRVWDFEGEVNSMQLGFGYINSDIYFQIDTCAGGYKPKRYDRVRGRAVECTRGRSPWRAIRVIPIQEIPQSPGVPQSPKLQTITDTLLANKENVKISESLQFGEVQNEESKIIKAFIRNESSETKTLVGCRVCSDDQSQFSVNEIDFVPPIKSLDLPVLIPPNKVVVVQLTCEARNLGADQKLIVFEFTNFKIGRYVSVNVHDSSYHDYLKPNTPYQRKSAINSYQNAQQQDKGWLVPGQRPSRSKLAIKLPNRLPQFVVPPLLEAAFHKGDSLVFVAPALGEDLCMDNYSDRFSALLHLEEIQEEIDIRLFNLERVGLRQVGEYLALSVPGLSEGRPSVLVGDSVILSSPGLCDNQPDYQGYVHEVLSAEVLLKFHNEFHNKYSGEDFNVRFTLNRTTTRRCHQAVSFAPSLGDEVLFPTKLIPKVPQTKVAQRAQSLGLVADTVKVSPVCGVKRGPLRRSASQTPKHTFFNPRLNARQKAAVLRILSGQARPTPYILFGPPGTGKTVTLVEALLQVLTNIPASRVIACTPSNSAADLLCQRLHASGKVKASDMVRFNSFSRSEDLIPAEILSYCKTGDDLELVSRHRLVISTCTTAGMMFTLGLRTGHYSHVFIDEAGQATEPEAIIPMGLVAGTDGQIVLAGDPRQLGPVLQSGAAKDYGLGQSLLERLIKLELYSRNEKKFADHGSYDPLLVTKLVENYRSHEALLKLPSVLFYHNELLASADPAMTCSLTHWEKLPNQDNLPLIFHGIRGEDMREGNSPSWFNPMEALQVMRYLQALNISLLTTLTFDDIGIITPYRKQVEKIRLLIDKLGMDKVKVGSVEEFQGQERLVMIISTVRSNERHVRADIRHNLGFLSNPKRFNVSISRAQALMIVIGNPHVLSQDENWKTLIKYSVENGAYVGCDLPDLTLMQDIDLQPCKRHPSSAQVEPNTSSSASAPAPALGSGDSVAKKLESELVEARVETTYSESDGDDTLSVHSADTEISVKLMRTKISPEPTQSPTAEELQVLPQHQQLEVIPQSFQEFGECVSAELDDTTETALTLPGSVTQTSEQHEETTNDSITDSGQDPCTEEHNVVALQHSSPSFDQQCIDLDLSRSTLGEQVTAAGDLPYTSEHTIEGTLPSSNSEEHTRIVPSPVSAVEGTSIPGVTSPSTKHDIHSHTPTTGSDHDPLRGALPERTSIADTSCPPLLKTQGRRGRKNTAERLLLSLNNSCASSDAGKRGSVSSSISSSDSLLNEVTSDCSDRDEKSNTIQKHRHTDTPVNQDKGLVDLGRKDLENKNTSDINSANDCQVINETEFVDRQGVHSDSPDSCSEHSSKEPDTNQCKDSLRPPSHVADVNGNPDDIATDTTSQYPADDNCTHHQVTELDKKIIRQVEYYYSTFNLSKDTFMQKLMAEDDGWITLDMLITFKRLRALSTDFSVILNALKKSTTGLLQVDTVLNKVRRSPNHPLPKDNGEWKLALKNRSAFIIGLKTADTAEELKKYFERLGTVEHIQMLKPQRRYKGETQVVTYPFVVVYQEPSDARALVAMKSGVSYKNNQLYAHCRDDILEMLYGSPSQGRGRNNQNRKTSYTDLKMANHQRRGNGDAEAENVSQGQTAAREEYSPHQRVSPNNCSHIQSPEQYFSHSPPQHYSHSPPQVTPFTSDIGDGLLPLPEGLQPLAQPISVVHKHRLGRGRAYVRTDAEPRAGKPTPEKVSHPSAALPAWPPSLPLPNTIAAVPSPEWKGRGRGRGLLHGAHNPVIVSPSSPNTSAEAVRDDSLEQDDSDVIIESSDEEYLED